MNLRCAIETLSVWLLVLCLSSAAESAGEIDGQVTFHGDIPRSTVPDDNGLRDLLLEVQDGWQGVRGVVVYLKIAPPGEDPARLPLAKMDQVNNRFVPRVLAVRAGQKVRFTNSDAGNHNVRAASSVGTNEFNVFTGVDGSYERAFAAVPNGQPVRIGCDIHPWMRGWIYVFDHSFFAVSGGDGGFRIPGVPSGEHELVFAQPDIGYREVKKVVVRSGQRTIVKAQARAVQPSTQ